MIFSFSVLIITFILYLYSIFLVFHSCILLFDEFNSNLIVILILENLICVDLMQTTKSNFVGVVQYKCQIYYYLYYNSP